ncbi:hypothetical protein LOK49_LG15G01767 [Camellia lanceoleosa]|uniref:Uncharacterized protein n=1 Tax=Camellia lanceoleosa TaxID=1840588 RepID=A0ACC0F630_9ERIC|nr:hypothetical protein LOK49_LG15G01767 [Camellia lanceoleosa]
MRELLQAHQSGILILMETKVQYSSMGNFFSNMGFSAATIVDLVGWSGGIWLIWDTDQVNVHASFISNQYIQATIHKEDYEEWVLNAIHASSTLLREALWKDLEDTMRNLNKPWLVAANQTEIEPKDGRIRHKLLLSSEDRVSLYF